MTSSLPESEHTPGKGERAFMLRVYLICGLLAGAVLGVRLPWWAVAAVVVGCTFYTLAKAVVETREESKADE